MKKIKRALINPVVEEEYYQPLEQKTEKIEISKDQLFLGQESLGLRFRQKVSNIEANIKFKSEITRYSPMWNTHSFAFLTITSVFNILIILLVGIFSYDTLPPSIPTFFVSANNTWEQTDKSIVFIMPIVLFVSFALQYRLIGNIFYHDRRLSNLLLWLGSFFNIIFLLGVSQIYKLIS